VEQSEISVRALYETHARSCDPKDFQNHVLRTPHGKPVAQDQVAMIADGIVRGLDIEPHDILLDLCCGNGAITDLIFARCRGGVGVDFTPYLIEVAKTNFETAPDRLYRLADAYEYVEKTDDAGRFTKVMCYGAFQCLLESKSAGVLSALRRRFPNVQRVLLGNLPDLDRAGIFWRQDMGSEPWPLHELKRHDTPFGIWRTEEEITKLAAACGWRTEISRMPPPYFCAHFRFDAILTAS
jgi:SAM-dependent methyltransferase